MSEFEVQVTISAQPEEILNALADIGNIHIWNPGIMHSEQTTSGKVGLGACRYCHLGGKHFLDEKVVEFEKPHKLTFRITNTNLPFQTADTRFSVEQQEGDSIVKVSPKYQLKFGWLGRMFDMVVMRPHYCKGVRNLLRGLKDYVEQPNRVNDSINRMGQSSAG